MIIIIIISSSSSSSSTIYITLCYITLLHCNITLCYYYMHNGSDARPHREDRGGGYSPKGGLLIRHLSKDTQIYN